MIEVVVCLWNGLVSLELCHELGILVDGTICDICCFIARVEEDHLLVLEMHRKMIDCGAFLMHGELKDVPAYLRWTYVMTIDVIIDLIYPLSNFDCGQVMAIVDILVNILDSLYGGANLYIDVTVVAC
jgi:hypothetical protein